MTELLPCPFCGGEAELSSRKAANGRKLYRYRCSECHAAIGRWNGGISGHPWTAREAWNTRHERICKVVVCGHDKELVQCMECGGAWNPDHDYLYEVNYCPNCGAKVVDA